MSFTHLDAEKVNDIRQRGAEEKHGSQTTPAYQDDVLRILESGGMDQPGDVIEVGCFLGGLTAQLAYACSVLNKTLHVVDVNVNYLAGAMHHLEGLGVSRNVVYFLGTLDSYLSRTRFNDPLFLVVVDGDHSYEGVLADIKSVLKYQPVTRNLIFHDYSLRYNTPDMQHVRVDKAIIDAFDGVRDIRPVGSLACAEGPLKIVPQPNGHYHEEGFHEGAHVELFKP